MAKSISTRSGAPRRQRGERGVGAVQRLDPVAEVGEHVGEEVADVGIVVDHDDARAAAARDLRLAPSHRLAGRPVGKSRRPRHAAAAGGRSCPRPRGSRSGASPPRLAGDAVDLGEAEAGALAERLGREERLGGARGDLGAHARGRCRRRRCRHSRRRRGRARPAPRTRPVEMVRVPPSGIASRALMARLRIAFSSWFSSHKARSASAPSRVRIGDRAADRVA